MGICWDKTLALPLSRLPEMALGIPVSTSIHQMALVSPSVRQTRPRPFSERATLSAVRVSLGVEVPSSTRVTVPRERQPTQRSLEIPDGAGVLVASLRKTRNSPSGPSAIALEGLLKSPHSVVALTTVVVPESMSLRNTSRTPLESGKLVRFVAKLSNSTQRPLADRIGFPDAWLPASPWGPHDRHEIAPEARLRNTTSETPFVSPGHRLAARVATATRSPREETLKASMSPSGRSESDRRGNTRSVIPEAGSRR